jgi:CubicO group peptidase (beta-lactamase class C family)
VSAVSARQACTWALCLVVLVLLGACTNPDDDAAAPQPASASTRAALTQAIEGALAVDTAGVYDDLRAVVVARGSQTVLERYFDSGVDETSAVASVTKSVMSLLIGIALEEGAITDVDQTLDALLPRYADVMDGRTRSVTLRQLLTMTAGFPADADSPVGPYSTSGKDWVRDILRAGVDQPPGSDFAYSSTTSYLLSAILTETTGQSALDYARENLFDNVGIDSRPAAQPLAVLENKAEYEAAGFAWAVDRQGRNLGDTSLKLTARDMLTLGQLALRGGRWQGRQLVPRQWIADSTRAQVQTSGMTPIAEEYGYQWWVTTAAGHPAFAAAGFGGQLIEVVPDLELVVVVSSTIPPVAARAGPALFLQMVDQFFAPIMER